ncbi:MAG: hypothetical protein U0Q11_00765 [Vicinamibacterales bacterium]
MSHERTIATQTHGRYLLEVAPGHPTRPLLVGFHGYGEQASIQMDRLRALNASGRFDLVSIQGLHRFYARGGDAPAASWMVKEDRELLIQDNIAYVDAVIGAVARECGAPTAIVFAGFSQGASMAYRAATLGAAEPWGVLAVGGDVPPELNDAQLARLPRVLIGAGSRDQWFTLERCASDAARLRRAGVQVEIADLDAGHHWTPELSARASSWLAAIG